VEAGPTRLSLAVGVRWWMATRPAPSIDAVDRQREVFQGFRLALPRDEVMKKSGAIGDSLVHVGVSKGTSRSRSGTGRGFEVSATAGGGGGGGGAGAVIAPRSSVLRARMSLAMAALAAKSAVTLGAADGGGGGGGTSLTANSGTRSAAASLPVELMEWS
jgi:hypothetical protein